MDNRTFISRLATAGNLENKETSRLVESLSAIIGECAAGGESLAVPGFGTFEAVKTDEHVLTDKVTGIRTLVPPAIRLNFKTGSRLKKSISKS